MPAAAESATALHGNIVKEWKRDMPAAIYFLPTHAP